MDEQQTQEIADRVTEALRSLAPTEPNFWENVGAFAPALAVVGALVVAWVGLRNLRVQQDTLRTIREHHSENLAQRSEADDRAEWWRRTQWALDATVSEDDALAEYGFSILRILAKSDLAGPEEADLLKTVLEETSTQMDEERIRQLVADAADFEPELTPAEETSLRSFGDVDDPADEGENEDSKEGNR